jgi:hypothetical protein
MVVVEILGVIALLVLAGSTTAMVVIGALGVLGAVSVERCPSCRRSSLRTCGSVWPCRRCAARVKHVHLLEGADDHDARRPSEGATIRTTLG